MRMRLSCTSKVKQGSNEERPCRKVGFFFCHMAEPWGASGSPIGTSNEPVAASGHEQWGVYARRGNGTG